MSLMSLNLHLPAAGTTRAAGGGRTDTATAASAIAELRRLLTAPGMLANPAVRRELHKLDEQLAAELPGRGGLPGRHRAGRGARPGPPALRGPLGQGPAKAAAPVSDHEQDERADKDGRADDGDRAGEDDQAGEGDRDDHDGADARGDRAAQAARPR